MKDKPFKQSSPHAPEGMMSAACIQESMTLAYQPDSSRMAHSGSTLSDVSHQSFQESLRNQRWVDAVRKGWILVKSGLGNAEVHTSIGVAYQQLGQFQAALGVFRNALVLGDETAELHQAAGRCCMALRDFGTSIAHFRKAIDLLGQDEPNILLHWGMALLESGEPGKAETALETGLKVAPQFAPLHFQLGVCAEANQAPDKALTHYSNAIRWQPKHVAALARAGHLLALEGRMDEALATFQQWAETAPEDPMAQIKIAQVLLARGMLLEAEQILQKVLQTNPGQAEGWVTLGQVQMGLGKFEASAENYQLALRSNPGHVAAELAQVTLAERLGEDEEVRIRCERLLSLYPDQNALLVINSRIARTSEDRESALKRIELALRGDLQRRGRDSESILRFAAGMLYDKLGRYDEAFDQYRQANEYQHGIKTHRRDVVASYFNRIQQTMTEEVMARIPQSSQHDLKPIFILGMPRSGTSLTEQILASHPDVYGAGELRNLDQLLRPHGMADGGYPGHVPWMDEDDLDQLALRYWSLLPPEAREAKRISDKMPHNFQYVGLIKKLFPGARIIHCTRDPRDNGLSCYFQYFAEGNSFSYDLEDFAHFYGEYRRLMSHWQKIGIDFFEVPYEQMATNPEPTIRALLAYCDLEWNDACLQFHQNKRVVRTASYQQVREPLHSRSVGRWQLYESHLNRLNGALSEWLRDSPAQ